MTSTTTRYKPTLEMRQATHNAQQADLEALARAVVVAITNRQKDLILRFPYFAVFAKDWPKGVIVKKEGFFDFYKVKVWKLANYLHEKGYLPANYKGLMLMQRDWGYREKKLERMLLGEIPLDNTSSSQYNSDLANVKEEE